MNALHRNAILVPSIARRRFITGLSAGVGCLTLPWEKSLAAEDEDISHSMEAIHHEVMLKAKHHRVYTVLTDAAQFQKLTLLSAAVASGMVKPTPPAMIGKAVGSAFSLFGGHITGRTIELVPDTRIVQAWRAGDWAEGIYSIAKFELKDEGVNTRLIFDHTGFPKGQAAHLAEGWKSNYWEPLANLSMVRDVRT
jgi:activator of HSP90 ATPase